jgi:hypothetical protein
VRKLIFILSISFCYELFGSDVVTHFSAVGRQCANAISVNALERSGIIVQDSAGLIHYVQLNPDSSIRNTKTIRAAGSLVPTAIAATSDNGFIVVGSIQTSSFGLDAIILKINASGGISWTKVLGTPDNDEFRSVAILNNGNIVALGHRTSSTTSIDLLVAGFSKSGGSLWKKIWGTNGLDHAGAIYSTSDHGAVISAGTEEGNVIYAFWMKLSATGAVSWTRIARIPDSTGLFYLSNPQGGFCLGSLSPLRQGQLAKTNVACFSDQGQRIWSKAFGVAGYSVTLAPGFVNQDGSIVLAGNAFTPGPSIDKGILAKISSTGGVQWKRSFTTPQDSAVTGAVLNSSSQTILAPACEALNTDSEDFALL